MVWPAQALLAALLSVLVLWPLPAHAQTDDPLYPQQWGLHVIGAERAWEISRGEGVIIAIIDTGVDLDHPDLENKLIQGFSLVDDAGPQDRHGHGTLIAGIAGAATGNGEGIASVAPDAKILPARVFDLEGNATSSKVSDAIRLAVDTAERKDAKLVLNLSFVGPADSSPLPGRDPAGAIFRDAAVRRAIEEAAAGGAVVVAAAGNDGTDTTAFDAPDGSGMIVVGASDQQGRCAPFTNYGIGLDILAPGVGIVSTFLNSDDRDSGYAHADGTSIAVPAVSGAAALLLSEGMSNVEAVERILSSAQGPAVNCGGGSQSYRVLDVAAALSAGDDEVGPEDRDRLSLPSLLHPAEQDNPVPMETPAPAAAAPPSDGVVLLTDVTALRALAAAALLAVSTLLWSRSAKPKD
ncbi:MAG: S8 family serine peptidase [Actinomycetota bacterium]